MPPDLIGGRYRLSRVIGRGGMGSVYLGQDEVLRRDVAVVSHMGASRSLLSSLRPAVQAPVRFPPVGGRAAT